MGEQMSDITIPSDEWRNWASYFAELFPTAGEGWIEQMTRRMLRELGFEGKSTRMSGKEYLNRVTLFQHALSELPPDSIKGGGEG